jgi:5'-nucleotidase
LKILITNDDGIASAGILALEKVLKRDHETFLIAPLKERSATSMAMSIFDPLRVEKINHDHIVVDGYPVDCVNVGLHGKIIPPVDLVVSGINRGVNMGHDVNYSGTVGAAKHAAIHGIKAIACSSGRIHPTDGYIPEAEMVLKIINEISDSFLKTFVYNINFPPSFSTNMNEIVYTKLGIRKYYDEYEVKPIIENIAEYYLGGSELGNDPIPGSDFEAYNQNKISISPVTLDQTEMAEYQRRLNKK